jgi:hypothetical protein
MRDAVVPCPKCKGDRVVLVGEVCEPCRRCKAQGLVPSPAFAVPLPPDDLEPHELAPWSAHYEPRGAA